VKIAPITKSIKFTTKGNPHHFSERSPAIHPKGAVKPIMITCKIAIILARSFGSTVITVSESVRGLIRDKLSASNNVLITKIA